MRKAKILLLGMVLGVGFDALAIQDVPDVPIATPTPGGTTGFPSTGSTGGSTTSSTGPLEVAPFQTPTQGTTGTGTTGASGLGTIGSSVPIDSTANVPVNPTFKSCLESTALCPAPPAGQVGHTFRLFLPGAPAQELTGFYDRNMVRLGNLGPNPPQLAKFRVEAFFAPICVNATSCTAPQSFRVFYQTSGVNQQAGERAIPIKNNFDAPRIVSRQDIMSSNPDPLSQVPLAGAGSHTAAQCLAAGGCLLGEVNGNPVCLNPTATSTIQAQAGNLSCGNIMDSGGNCPAGWTAAPAKQVGGVPQAPGCI